jgi:hypothetical protein
MTKQSWLDRELGWLELVGSTTGIRLSDTQRAAIVGHDAEDLVIWQPDNHVVPFGLTRGTVIELASHVGVKLSNSKRNCSGNDTLSVASVQMWDIDALLEGQRDNVPPWNMTHEDQMSWCRENGEGAWLPVEWLYALAQYQFMSKNRPMVLDQRRCRIATDEQDGNTYRVYIYSDPGCGVWLETYFYRSDMRGSCGVAARKRVWSF